MNRATLHRPLEPNVPGLADLLSVGLDPSDGRPLHRQLYFALREAILSGRLRPGSRLPATRKLAAELHMARNTVAAAYDQLIAEGYVTAQVGSGTRVSAELPDVYHAPEERTADGSNTKTPPKPSTLALALQGHGRNRKHARDRKSLPFRSAIPALDAFPWALWARLLARHWRRPGRVMTVGEHPGGLPTLRSAVAQWLRTSRALACEPDQVIILGGAQQGLDLAARLLVNREDVVAVEDPGFSGVDGALMGVGATLVPVPVDAEGLVVAALPEATRAVMVTPSRNYPLGITMTLARRLDLLEWARSRNAWVIEDDYDSEFRYDGRPVASVQGLDRTGRVVYLGTFSRVLFPALRLGYLVVPRHLIGAAHSLRSYMDGHESTVAQAALADFFIEGHFAGHVRAMRSLYSRRRTFLAEELTRRFGERLTILGTDGGMHLVALLPRGLDDRDVVEKLRNAGVEATPLSLYHHKNTGYHHKNTGAPGLVLGFAGWPEEILTAACGRLESVLRPLLTSRCPPGV